MSKTTVYTYSIIYTTFPAFTEKAPYISALLQREDGTRFPSLVEGYQEGKEVRIGQEIQYLGKNQQGQDIYSL
jgi:uncharacterized OB-fold protein